MTKEGEYPSMANVNQLIYTSIFTIGLFGLNSRDGGILREAIFRCFFDKVLLIIPTSN